MGYVGQVAPHASLVSDPSTDKFMVRMGGNPRLSIEASSATVHNNLSCVDMSTSNLTSANDLTVGGNATISGTLTVNGNPVGSSLSALEGNGISISGSDIKLDYSNWITQGFADQVDQSGFSTNGILGRVQHLPQRSPDIFTNQPHAYIEFDIIADTCLINLTKW